MATLSGLNELAGVWKGIKHLRLSPNDSVRTSESKAEVAGLAHDQFNEIRYTWSDEGHIQEGRLILGQIPGKNTVEAVWFDTWHSPNRFMICEGRIGNDGILSIRGTYPAPPGPDWGWEISIESIDSNGFRLLMHNVSPKKEKYKAVEVLYERCRSDCD